MKKLISFLKWPLAALCLFLAVMWLFFGTDFFTISLKNAIGDPEWWATNTLAYVLFGLFVSFMTFGLQQRNSRLMREPFDGWKLEIIGLDDKPQDIYWSDVEKFSKSQFELWKFVKSNVGNYCRIKTPDIETARIRGWLCGHDFRAETGSPEKANRVIIIDLTKLESADILSWSWSPGIDQTAPKGFDWGPDINSKESKPLLVAELKST